MLCVYFTGILALPTKTYKPEVWLEAWIWSQKKSLPSLKSELHGRNSEIMTRMRDSMRLHKGFQWMADIGKRLPKIPCEHCAECISCVEIKSNLIWLTGNLRIYIFFTEYSRYLHAHLDTPLTEYNVDMDLPGKFKNHWAKNLPFLIEDYEEQPGLQPHIKWVTNCCDCKVLGILTDI